MPEGGLSSSARQGANLEMFMKLTAIAILVLLTFVARGVRPTIIMIILVFPLWWLAEKVMANTDAPSFWKSIEEREDFSRLPLVEDINKMEGAREGQKVKQAILEGRLKDQVYYTLKNEYNLSEEEIKILDEDPDSITKKIDNKELIKYLKHARDLNDLKKPNGGDQFELFSEEKNGDFEGEKIKFEEKIKSAVVELEKIHHIEEDR
ncbi:MAG: hypothetical protein V5A76_04885 [Candidatus Thermoplasmatota archaeon]